MTTWKWFFSLALTTAVAACGSASADGSMLAEGASAGQIPALAYGAAGQHLLKVSSDALYRSVNGGEHWEQVSAVMEARALATGPQSGGIYAGRNDSLLLRSADQGRTWEWISA